MGWAGGVASSVRVSGVTEYVRVLLEIDELFADQLTIFSWV